jgi:hypothetical protein
MMVQSCESVKLPGALEMANQLSDLHRVKRGVAALVTCVVATLNESDPSFQKRFLEKLDKAYYKFRDDTDGDVTQELELLSWTTEYLSGWNKVTGQGKPLLAD